MPPPASSSSPLRSWHGAGERPLQVSEELALDQAGAERGQADRQERAVAPAAVAVDRPGDQLLAGAALAGDEDRDVGRRDQGDALEQVLHGRRLPIKRLGFALGRAGQPVPGSCGFSRARLTTVVAWSRSNGLTR